MTADRLKITLPTSYMVSRLAWSCLLHQDTYAEVEYNNETMLHWCLREVEWGTDWLLRTHVFSGSVRPTEWAEDDQFVVQVSRLRVPVPSNVLCSRTSKRVAGAVQPLCLGEPHALPSTAAACAGWSHLHRRRQRLPRRFLLLPARREPTECPRLPPIWPSDTARQHHISCRRRSSRNCGRARGGGGAAAGPRRGTRERSTTLRTCTL